MYQSIDDHPHSIIAVNVNAEFGRLVNQNSWWLNHNTIVNSSTCWSVLSHTHTYKWLLLHNLLSCKSSMCTTVQTLATKPSPTRTFCIFKSPWMTGCGRRECRYSIPQTTPWARNNFVGQPTWNCIQKLLLLWSQNQIHEISNSISFLLLSWIWMNMWLWQTRNLGETFHVLDILSYAN